MIFCLFSLKKEVAFCEFTEVAEEATASSAILIKLFILCYALVRVHIHRAELIKIENLIVAAYSFRLVESGAFVLQLDPNHRDDKDRGEAEERHG